MFNGAVNFPPADIVFISHADNMGLPINHTQAFFSNFNSHLLSSLGHLRHSMTYAQK
jgi:hypothetical protein